MNFSCPDCRGALKPVEGDRLRCEAHGGEYLLLYRRAEPPPLPVAALAAPDPGAPGAPPPVTGSVPPPPPPVEVHHCLRHPNVVAVARCARCGGYSCATCDFEFPGGLHLCPRCATEPVTSLSPRRKRLVIASYALVGLATLTLALLSTGALGTYSRDPVDQQVLGMIASVFIYIPALVGLGMSFSARERRLPNPPLLWGALIWNIAVCAILAILTIYGLAK